MAPGAAGERPLEASIPGGPLDHQEVVDPRTHPFPRMVLLQQWAKLRWISALSQGDVVEASAELQHLAWLTYTTESRLGGVVAWALLSIERKAYAEAARRGPVPAAWKPMDPKQLESAGATQEDRKPLLQPRRAPAEVMERISRCGEPAQLRCASVTELVPIAVLFRPQLEDLYADRLQSMIKPIEAPGGCQFDRARLYARQRGLSNPKLPGVLGGFVSRRNRRRFRRGSRCDRRPSSIPSRRRRPRAARSLRRLQGTRGPLPPEWGRGLTHPRARGYRAPGFRKRGTNRMKQRSLAVVAAVSMAVGSPAWADDELAAVQGRAAVPAARLQREESARPVVALDPGGAGRDGQGRQGRPRLVHGQLLRALQEGDALSPEAPRAAQGQRPARDDGGDRHRARRAEEDRRPDRGEQGHVPGAKDRFNIVARRWLGTKSPLPSLFMVRPDGTVSAVHRGYSTDGAELLGKEVELALGHQEGLDPPPAPLAERLPRNGDRDRGLPGRGGRTPAPGKKTKGKKKGGPRP